mgnify:CR=1 FL=1
MPGKKKKSDFHYMVCPPYCGRKKKGGNLLSTLRLAPALAKALLKALAVKTAKKAALPAVAGTAGYVAGRKHKRPITIKY